MFMRLLTGIALLVACTAAHAETITFDQALAGQYLRPVYSEGSFSVTNLAGKPSYETEPYLKPSNVVLYQDPIFITGSTVPADYTGIVGITLTKGGLFTFSSLDAVAINYNAYFQGSSLPLVLSGYRNNVLLATETINLTIAKTLSDPLTTRNSSVLNGIALDQLQITFTGADAPAGNGFQEYIDNIAVTPLVATTPEPSSFFLLSTGLLGAGLMVRRRLACATTRNP